MNNATSASQPPYVSRNHVGDMQGSFGSVTGDQKDTVIFAIRSYGHLIQRNETVTLGDFADRISKVYDEAEPHNAAVIAALRTTGNTVGKKVPLA